MRSLPVVLAVHTCLSILPARATDIRISPSGHDDTETIRLALTGCSPGDRILLDGGTYRIRPIAVRGFQGTLRGAGRETTRIEPLPHLAITQDEPFDARPPSADNPWPVLLLFLDGDVTISDLSFFVTPPDPTTGWFLVSGYRTSALFAAVAFTGEQSRSVVERVVVVGAAGDLDDRNLTYGIVHAGTFRPAEGIPDVEGVVPLRGDHTVRDVAVDSVAVGLAAYDEVGAVVRFGAPSAPNRISGSGVGILVGSIEDSIIDLLHNEFSAVAVGIEVHSLSATDLVVERNELTEIGVYGLWIVQENRLPAGVSDITISQNRMARGSDGGSAVIIVDAAALGGGQSARFTVLRNRIESLRDDALWIPHATRPIVAENTFLGAGRAAIHVGRSQRDPASAMKALLFCNDVADFAASRAANWLDRSSSSCLVVDDGRSEILDEGTGNRVVRVRGSPRGRHDAAWPSESGIARTAAPSRALR